MATTLPLSEKAVKAASNYARALIEVDAASQEQTDAEQNVESAKKARDVAHVELIDALFERV